MDRMPESLRSSADGAGRTELQQTVRESEAHEPRSVRNDGEKAPGAKRAGLAADDGNVGGRNFKAHEAVPGVEIGDDFEVRRIHTQSLER